MLFSIRSVMYVLQIICKTYNHKSLFLKKIRYSRATEPLTTEINQVAVYEITSVSKRDEGAYVCLGKNTAGASEERVHLTVEEADRFPTRGDNPGNFY